MTPNKYRFDRRYEKVYEWDEQSGAYVFLCTFWQIGAIQRNKDETIIKRIEEWKNGNRLGKL